MQTDSQSNISPVVDADPWSKSVDWRGFKISGSAHLWCLHIKGMPASRRRRCHAWDIHTALVVASVIFSACIKAQTPWWL